MLWLAGNSSVSCSSRIGTGKCLKVKVLSKSNLPLRYMASFLPYFPVRWLSWRVALVLIHTPCCVFEQKQTVLVRRQVRNSSEEAVGLLLADNSCVVEV